MATLEPENKSANRSWDHDDFFDGVYSNGPYTPLTILVFILGVVLGVLGSIHIIWYERNCSNRYRTVINQLLARINWYILFYALLIHIPEGVRFWYGPYGETYCNFLLVLRNILWDSVLLTLDCIVALRYLYIFTVKNFAVICDDILARILNLSILFISFWAAFVKRVTPGNLPIVYFLCSGKNPNKEEGEGHFLQTQSKYNTGRIIVVTSFLFHLLLVPRILYYQVVTLSHQRPLQLGTINNEYENNDPEETRRRQNENKLNKYHQNSNKTIIDIATQAFFLALLVIYGVIILVSENVEPNKINIDLHQYIPYTIQIYGPFFAYITVYTIMFTRNEAMRKTLGKKLMICPRKPKVGIEE